MLLHFLISRQDESLWLHKLFQTSFQRGSFCRPRRTGAHPDSRQWRTPHVLDVFNPLRRPVNQSFWGKKIEKMQRQWQKWFSTTFSWILSHMNYSITCKSGIGGVLPKILYNVDQLLNFWTHSSDKPPEPPPAWCLEPVFRAVDRCYVCRSVPETKMKQLDISNHSSSSVTFVTVKMHGCHLHQCYLQGQAVCFSRLQLQQTLALCETCLKHDFKVEHVDWTLLLYFICKVSVKKVYLQW